MSNNSSDNSGSEAFVRFQDVQKSYDGEILVVKGLNLDISKGEFLTMLGPSGSGKSTCLMMLAGFETPTHGEILLDGNSITNIAPHHRGIGMVFQNYALFPHMTIYENLAFPLEVRKMSADVIKEKVGKTLDMVRMGGFENRRPGQLSGGQAQRIAVARALVFEPELILMDEPLGALDKQLREQMQYEIKHIHENLGVTVVYVTHDQSEALTMSDRVAVFNDGIIQQLATPEVLYEQPENAFVAQFIGENNKLEGHIKSQLDNKLCEVELAGNQVVTALNVQGRDIGADTSMSIRPERVILNPRDDQVDNKATGKITESIYLGDHLRLNVRAFGEQEFVMKVPNATEHSSLIEGTEVSVGWRSEDCRALDPFTPI